MESTAIPNDSPVDPDDMQDDVVNRAATKNKPVESSSSAVDNLVRSRKISGRSY